MYYFYNKGKILKSRKILPHSESHVCVKYSSSPGKFTAQNHATHLFVHNRTPVLNTVSENSILTSIRNMQSISSYLHAHLLIIPITYKASWPTRSHGFRQWASPGGKHAEDSGQNFSPIRFQECLSSINMQADSKITT